MIGNQGAVGGWLNKTADDLKASKVTIRNLGVNETIDGLIYGNSELHLCF